MTAFVLWVGWFFICSVVSTVVVYAIDRYRGTDSPLVQEALATVVLWPVVAGPARLCTLAKGWIRQQIDSLRP